MNISNVFFLNASSKRYGIDLYIGTQYISSMFTEDQIKQFQELLEPLRQDISNLEARMEKNSANLERRMTNLERRMTRNVANLETRMENLEMKMELRFDAVDKQIAEDRKDSVGFFSHCG